MKRIASLLCTLALIVVGVVGLPGAASAFGEQGVLLVKGPGSAYAGTNALVSLTGSPGATSSFAFKVRNTGSAEAQYKVVAYNWEVGCASNGACDFASTYVTSGSLQTRLAGSSNGYYTPPIAAGKTGLFALKVVVPKVTGPNELWKSSIWLYDTSSTLLGSVEADVNNKTKTGTAAYDEFVNGASQQPVHDQHFLHPDVTNPSLALNGTSKYTVKLTNNGPAAASIHFHLVSGNACTTFFPATVKSGTTDVTALALAGTYVTPLLNHGQATTLTVSVKYVATLNGCGAAYAAWNAVSGDGTNTQTVALIENPATT
jgi:hypothetical protein